MQLEVLLIGMGVILVLLFVQPFGQGDGDT